MSRLLRALGGDFHSSDDIQDAYDDDFLDGLQNEVPDPPETKHSIDSKEISLSTESSDAASDKNSPEDGYTKGSKLDVTTGEMKKFIQITHHLPYELKQKIFRLCFGGFYRIDLLSYLDDECLRPVIQPFYDELLIGDGKLYFGGFNEYDVMKFDDERFQHGLKQMISDKVIQINILKIFDTDAVDNDDLLLLLSRADKVWCASVSALVKTFRLNPDILCKITDLSIESLDHLTRQQNLKPIFERLRHSLKDFTLPPSMEDTASVKTILDTLANIDHKLTIHIPISYPLDGFRDYEFFQGIIDPYNTKIEFAHLLFTLLYPGTQLSELDKFMQRVGYKKFTDFCLASWPAFKIQGDLHFLSELENLVTIIISGKFIVDKYKFGDLSKLSHLEELMLENCTISCGWFNTCLPKTLKDITLSYASFAGEGIYHIPSNVKVLTILANDTLDMTLKNVDFGHCNLSVLKVRVDDNALKNVLKIQVKSLPPRLREFNCYKLTGFIVEKDINLSKKKKLSTIITVSESLPSGLCISNIKANVNVSIRAENELDNDRILGEVKRTESIGGFLNHLAGY